jgi:hypothetical protein
MGFALELLSLVARYGPQISRPGVSGGAIDRHPLRRQLVRKSPGRGLDERRSGRSTDSVITRISQAWHPVFCSSACHAIICWPVSPIVCVSIMARGYDFETGFAPLKQHFVPLYVGSRVAEAEQRAITTTLSRLDRNLSATARALAIDRNTLKRKMVKYGLR